MQLFSKFRVTYFFILTVFIFSASGYSFPYPKDAKNHTLRAPLITGTDTKNSDTGLSDYNKVTDSARSIILQINDMQGVLKELELAYEYYGDFIRPEDHERLTAYYKELDASILDASILELTEASRKMAFSDKDIFLKEIIDRSVQELSDLKNTLQEVLQKKKTVVKKRYPYLQTAEHPAIEPSFYYNYRKKLSLEGNLLPLLGLVADISSLDKNKMLRIAAEKILHDDTTLFIERDGWELKMDPGLLIALAKLGWLKPKYKYIEQDKKYVFSLKPAKSFDTKIVLFSNKVQENEDIIKFLKEGKKVFIVKIGKNRSFEKNRILNNIKDEGGVIEKALRDGSLFISTPQEQDSVNWLREEPFYISGENGFYELNLSGGQPYHVDSLIKETVLSLDLYNYRNSTDVYGKASSNSIVLKVKNLLKSWQL